MDQIRGLANKKSWKDRRGLLPLSTHLGVPRWLSNYLGVMSLVKSFATRIVVCIKTHNKVGFPKYRRAFPIP